MVSNLAKASGMIDLYLHNVGVAVGDGLNLDGVAKAALSNDLQLAVPVHLSLLLL